MSAKELSGETVYGFGPKVSKLILRGNLPLLGKVRVPKWIKDFEAADYPELIRLATLSNLQPTIDELELIGFETLGNLYAWQVLRHYKVTESLEPMMCWFRHSLYESISEEFAKFFAAFPTPVIISLFDKYARLDFFFANSLLDQMNVLTTLAAKGKSDRAQVVKFLKYILNRPDKFDGFITTAARTLIELQEIKSFSLILAHILDGTLDDMFIDLPFFIGKCEEILDSSEISERNYDLLSSVIEDAMDAEDDLDRVLHPVEDMLFTPQGGEMSESVSNLLNEFRNFDHSVFQRIVLMNLIFAAQPEEFLELREIYNAFAEAKSFAVFCRMLKTICENWHTPESRQLVEVFANVQERIKIDASLEGSLAQILFHRQWNLLVNQILRNERIFSFLVNSGCAVVTRMLQKDELPEKYKDFAGEIKNILDRVILLDAETAQLEFTDMSQTLTEKGISVLEILTQIIVEEIFSIHLLTFMQAPQINTDEKDLGLE